MTTALVLHASCGAGHRRAAEAIAAAARAPGIPGLKVVVRDVLDLTPPPYRRLYRSGYDTLVRRLPRCWGALYRWTDAEDVRSRRLRLLVRADRLGAGRGFERALRSLAPDVVIATHFLPLELRRSPFSAGPPRVCVVTDYRAHALWCLPGADLYAVAAEETSRDLMARGVPRERIAVTGIPVDPRFAPVAARRAARPAGGVRRLLVLSGGAGVGDPGPLLRALDAAFDDLSITVSAGANPALLARLRRVATTLRTPVRVVGLVEDVPSLFAEADLLITKPGGLTLTEAAVAGLPLVLVPGIPGQEEGNARHFAGRGAAARAAGAGDVVDEIRRLRVSASLRARRSRALLALARPGAAAEILHRAAGLLPRRERAAAAD
jgi:processive 1,2-diacylglycerol beta-glucosyltransferase